MTSVPGCTSHHSFPNRTFVTFARSTSITTGAPCTTSCRITVIATDGGRRLGAGGAAPSAGPRARLPKLQCHMLFDTGQGLFDRGKGGDAPVSDYSEGSGWWQASDRKWYPPELHPDYESLPPPPPGHAGRRPPTPTVAPRPRTRWAARRPHPP